MKTIGTNITSEYIVNKSKFIVKLINIDNINIDNYLKQIKEEYKGANHYCYAYVFENYYKSSDDKEPTNTAGLPILNVLKNNNLDHILCIVVRYFGGIKLGIGGLSRAYSNSVIEAVNKSDIIEIAKGYKVRIEFGYDLVNYINKKIENYFITYKEYDELITYEFLISINDFESIKKELETSSKLDIIDNLYVKI